jgi:hypothetical protein
VNFPVNNGPWCIGSNAKTLVLQYLQLHNTGASGGHPDGTCVVHHGIDELLIQQNTIPDGDNASVEDRTQFPHQLFRFISHPTDIVD